MKTNSKLIALTLSVILLAASCVELDLTPYDRESDLSFWKKPEAAIYTLNACYPSLSNAFEVLYFDCMTDNAYTKVSNAFNQYIGNGSYSTADAYVQSIWSSRYAGIRKCNLLLNNIDQVPDLSESLRNRYVAEATVIRAFHYFELYSKFGDIPYFTNILLIEESQSIERTAKSVVVENILNDLTEVISKNYLPVSYDGDNKGRVTHWAAAALKARILLFEGRYAEVKSVTEDIINNGGFQLFGNYEQLFTVANENNSEVILDVQYIGNSREHNVQYHFLPPSLGGYSQLSPTQELVDSYATTDGFAINNAPESSFDPEAPFENRDPRLAGTVIYTGNSYPMADGTNHVVNTDKGGGVDGYAASSDASATGYYLKKYWDKTYRASLMSGLNIILIRYADVLLMHAEALVELGEMNASGWDKTIRPLRARAGFAASALEFPSGSQNELRKIVRRERRSELAMEGLRHTDIIRWKIAENVMNGWIHGIKTDEAIGTDNGFVRVEQRTFDASKHYLMPIPQNERDLNPNLEQNPNW
jgi:hypothetical protein